MDREGLAIQAHSKGGARSKGTTNLTVKAMVYDSPSLVAILPHSSWEISGGWTGLLLTLFRWNMSVRS